MIKINLLTVRVPRAVRLVQKQALSFMAALIVAVVVAVAWTSAVYAAKSTAETELAAEKAKLAKLEPVTKRLEEFEAKKKRREDILEAIQKLEERKRGPRPYLDQLNVLLPPDVWLADMSVSGVGINLTGYSFSNNAIAELMRVLEASDQFQDIELGVILNEVVQKENVKRFTLSGRLRALAKLEEGKKAAAPAPAKPAPAPAPAPVKK